MREIEKILFFSCNNLNINNSIEHYLKNDLQLICVNVSYCDRTIDESFYLECSAILLHR